MTPSGAATAAAAPERNSVRRSSNRLPRCPFSDIVVLLCTHATTLAATREPRCRLAREMFDSFSPDENSWLSFR